MGLRIGTNVSALTATRNLSRVSGALGRNFEHLATGSRISRASDDAAGVAISARLRARVRGLDQSVRNAQDGISLIQTAEGSLGEIESSIIRMRELAIQAKNGTLSSSDRTALDTEFDALKASITAVAGATQFNGASLLSSGSVKTFQVGPDTTAGVDTLLVTMVDAQATGASIAVNSLDIGAVASIDSAIAQLDTALQNLGTFRATFGSAQNRLESTVSSLQTRSENLSAANSRIQDVDVATETAMLTKNSILQQASISVLAQANAAPQAALALLQ